MFGQKFKTMFITTLLVFVSVVSADINNTSDVTETKEVKYGKSRMAWMKSLLDHHGWTEFVGNSTLLLPKQCAADLKTYLDALYTGQLWASKSKSLSISLEIDYASM